MKRKRRTLLSLAFLLMIASCSDPQNEIHKYTFFAFGTIVELTITGTDQETADKAAKILETDFKRMHHDWHAWHPGPLLSINQHLARGEPAPVDDKMMPLLKRAKELALMSEGTFNPLIGKLLEIWGFHNDEMPEKPPPEKAITDFLKNAPNPADLTFNKQRVAIDNPTACFDLGGFAKGYGIDRAIDRLKKLGIRNAIVNAGGDLKAIGKRHDRRWRIGIRHPRKAGVIASIDVNDGESVFTSGDYERYFIYEGKRYHHILDPRTGYPATDFISVTIINPDAGLSDAAATAILVAGHKDWKKIAKKMGVDTVMVIDKQGNIMMTPAMKPRIHLVVHRIDDENR